MSKKETFCMLTDTEVAQIGVKLKELMATQYTATRQSLAAVHKLRDRLENEFMRRHGIKVSKRACGAPAFWSVPMADHVEMYVTLGGGRYVCVSQPYTHAAGSWEPLHRQRLLTEITAWEKKHGGVGQIIDDYPSWWNPGFTSLVMFTVPAHTQNGRRNPAHNAGRHICRDGNC